MICGYLDNNNTIINVVDLPELREGYIEIPEGCVAWVDWTYIDGSFFPPIPKPKVPEFVTMRQARLALLYDGKLANVITAINSIPGEDGDAARIEWDYSGSVYRHKPLVLSMGAILGLSSADLDTLFINAAGISEGA